MHRGRCIFGPVGGILLAGNLAAALVLAALVWALVDGAMRRGWWRPWMLLVLCPVLAFWPLLLAR